jgi:mono/diheme cytochrome c family protein
MVRLYAASLTEIKALVFRSSILIEVVVTIAMSGIHNAKGHGMNAGKQVDPVPTGGSDDTDFQNPLVLERTQRVRRPRQDGPLRGRFSALRSSRLLSSLLSAFVCGALPVAAQTTSDNARGELLYSTHCGSCHTAQVHWRDKKLATDWPSLRAQVHRWESNIGMNWTDDDIVAVARYLNTHYYRFPAPDTAAATQQPLPRASAP